MGKKQTTTTKPATKPVTHGLGSAEPRGLARWTPEERRTFATLGAYTRLASTDTREMTVKARQAFTDSWLRKADPDGVLPPDERARRAEALRKAHYARMSLARWGKIEKAPQGQQQKAS